VKRKRMARIFSTHGINENAYKILALNPQGKCLFGRRRHRSENNVTMDVK
jgi:hypothetical protein